MLILPAHDHDETSMVAFLICELCGSVGEIPAAPVARSVNAAARASGFAPKMSVVEIAGTCAHCASATAMASLEQRSWSWSGDGKTTGGRFDDARDVFVFDMRGPYPFWTFFALVALP